MAAQLECELNADTRGDGNVEKCVNCQFYDRRSGGPTDGRAAMWGQCRRHSPHLNPLSAKSYLVEGVWPLIRDDDWCGEWRATTQTSISRMRFTPRADELATTAAAGTNGGTANHSVAAAAGDD
jgi:hypothetical protein